MSKVKQAIEDEISNMPPSDLPRMFFREAMTRIARLAATEAFYYAAEHGVAYSFVLVKAKVAAVLGEEPNNG